jgi:hypothetical protein
MRLTWLAAVVLLPAGDDKAAQELLKAVRERIEQAKSVRIEARIGTVDGIETIWDATVSLRLRGRDCWALEVRQAQASKDSVEGGNVTAFCDGRKIILAAAPAGASLPTLKPDDGGQVLRWSVAVGGLSDLESYLYRDPDEPPAAPVAPVIADVKDGGTQKVGDVEARVVEYSIRFGGPRLSSRVSKVRLFIDPASKRPLRKEFTTEGGKSVESYTAFELDEDLPDSDFSFQSNRRLARVRAAQIARSVSLYGTFTGRHPRSLDDLAARPSHLEPEVFWPEGGFVLGGVVPKDPWGRPFELKVERSRAWVVGLGSDGKPGGSGDAEDTEVAVAPVTRRPVGAPTERLRNQYTARVQIQLLALALRAFRDSTGELPRRKSALWEKPVDSVAWPEGGFLPGGRVPLDPWGEPYRIISDPDRVRVQVRDPEARKLSQKGLAAEETKKLEEAARVRVSYEERRAMNALLDRLSEDDFDAREKAEHDLKAWGPTVLSILEERLKTEKDPEARLRVEGVRRAVPAGRPAWSKELATLAVTITRSDELQGDQAQLTACQNNLSQLWKMQCVYMSQFGGRMKRMPDATGKEFWLALSKTQPPLIDPTVADIFICPASGKDSKDGGCTYRGPAVNVAKLADGDVVGMCDDEAHGDVAVILRKSGDAIVISRSDPLYEAALEKTKP